MKYESIHSGFSIPTTNGVLKFQRSELGFGEFNTKDAGWQKRLGMTEQELNECIEAVPLFKRHVPGRKGVWRQDDRIGADEARSRRVGANSLLENMTSDQLKQLIADRGSHYPSDATHDMLVDICANLYDAPTVAAEPVAEVKTVGKRAPGKSVKDALKGAGLAVATPAAP